MELTVAIFGDKRVNLMDHFYSDVIKLKVISNELYDISKLICTVESFVNSNEYLIYDAVIFVPFLYDFAQKINSSIVINNFVQISSILKGIYHCEELIKKTSLYSVWCIPYPVIFKKDDINGSNTNDSKTFYNHLKFLKEVIYDRFIHVNVFDFSQIYMKDNDKLTEYLENSSKSDVNDHQQIYHRHISKAYEYGEEKYKECYWCSQSHLLNECTDFRRKKPDEIREFLNLNRICFGCLSKTHKTNYCPSLKCHCGLQHPTSLHNLVINHCLYCYKNHSMARCIEFNRLESEVKYDILMERKICTGCLMSSNHTSKSCPNKELCFCGSTTHPSTIHFYYCKNSEDSISQWAKVNKRKSIFKTGCVFCAGNHNISTCTLFQNKTFLFKIEYLFLCNICFMCMKSSSNHTVDNCPSRLICKYCKSGHPNVFHDDFKRAHKQDHDNKTIYDCMLCGSYKHTMNDCILFAELYPSLKYDVISHLQVCPHCLLSRKCLSGAQNSFCSQILKCHCNLLHPSSLHSAQSSLNLYIPEKFSSIEFIWPVHLTVDGIHPSITFLRKFMPKLIEVIIDIVKNNKKTKTASVPIKMKQTYHPHPLKDIGDNAIPVILRDKIKDHDNLQRLRNKIVSDSEAQQKLKIKTLKDEQKISDDEQVKERLRAVKEKQKEEQRRSEDERVKERLLALKKKQIKEECQRNNLERETFDRNVSPERDRSRVRQRSRSRSMERYISESNSYFRRKKPESSFSSGMTESNFLMDAIREAYSKIATKSNQNQANPMPGSFTNESTEIIQQRSSMSQQSTSSSLQRNLSVPSNYSEDFRNISRSAPSTSSAESQYYQNL